MADTLRLIIDIDGKRASSELNKLIKQMEQAGNASTKLQKQTMMLPKSVEAMATQMRNSMRAVENAMNSTANAMHRIQNITRTTQGSIGNLGSRTAAVGGIMQRGLGGVVNSLQSIARTALTATAALSGLGAMKVSSDYLEFSKMVGQANTIIMGSPETAPVLEQIALRGSAGTGKTPTDILRMSRSLMSTASFDPHRGGAMPGTEEFRRNLESQEPTLKKMALFATANDVEGVTMMESAIRMANVLDLNITAAEDVNTLLDSYAALLKTSQGELQELTPETAKFLQNFKLLGVTANESLAIFSTLTNVFGVPEAGTRALALSNWASQNTKKVDAIAEIDKQYGTRYADEYYKALYFTDPTTGKEKARDVVTQVKNVMDLMSRASQEQGDFIGNLISSTVFGEIRQTSGVRTISQMGDTLDETLGVFEKNMGMASKGIDAYNTTIGAKLDTTFKNLQATAFTAGTALLEIFFNLDKGVNLDNTNKVFDELAASMRAVMGEGAGGMVEKVKEIVNYIGSEQGRTRMKAFADGMVQIATSIMMLVEALASLSNAPGLRQFLDFVAANPVAAIGGVMGANLISGAGAGAVAGGVGAGIAAGGAAGAAPAVAKGILPIAVGLAVGYAITEVDKALANRNKEQKAFEDVVNKQPQRETAIKQFMATIPEGSPMAMVASKEWQKEQATTSYMNAEKKLNDFMLKARDDYGMDSVTYYTTLQNLQKEATESLNKVDLLNNEIAKLKGLLSSDEGKTYNTGLSSFLTGEAQKRTIGPMPQYQGVEAMLKETDAFLRATADVHKYVNEDFMASSDKFVEAGQYVYSRLIDGANAVAERLSNLSVNIASSNSGMSTAKIPTNSSNKFSTQW